MLVILRGEGGDQMGTLDFSGDTDGRFLLLDLRGRSHGVDVSLGSGNDFIYSRGLDTIDGGGGNDTIIHRDSDLGATAEGPTLIRGGSGDDEIWLLGGAFRSNASYTSGVEGGDGDDTLRGSDGIDDFLYGGDGNDDLYGGKDGDYFIFASGDTGTDTIHDFEVGDDLLEFKGLDASSIMQSVDGGTLTLTASDGTDAQTIILSGVSETLDVTDMEHMFFSDALPVD